MTAQIRLHFSISIAGRSLKQIVIYLDAGLNPEVTGLRMQYASFMDRDSSSWLENAISNTPGRSSTILNAEHLFGILNCTNRESSL